MRNRKWFMAFLYRYDEYTHVFWFHFVIVSDNSSRSAAFNFCIMSLNDENCVTAGQRVKSVYEYL